MAFMHFDDSIDIINRVEIDSSRVRKLYLTDAIGYTLAEDIVANHNSPEYPTSAMDGYAVRHSDLEMGKLVIDSINPAGSTPQGRSRGG